MIKQPRILWMIPKWTLPATDGARVATDRLVKNIVKCGARVDILCLGNPEDNINIKNMLDTWKVENVFYLQREIPTNKFIKIIFYLTQLVFKPKCPLTMTTFTTKKVLNFIDDILDRNEYDDLFLDGLHLGAPFIKENLFIKPKNIGKVIYRAHNIEEDIWLKASKDSSNFIKSLFLKYQAKRVQKYENMIISSSNLVVPISVEDNELILKKNKNIQTHIALMGMDFDHPLDFENKLENNFLFLGRLDWPPNKDGLKWLLDNVWPHVDHSTNTLHIAGSGNRAWLDKYKNGSGIKMHGFVDNIDDLYKMSDAALIPIFYGSGTRIKVVECYSKGRSMISTQMGAQGSSLIPSIDYILCETENEWIEAINSFSKEKAKSFAKIGHQKLSLTFDQFEVANKLYQKLL